MFIFPVVLGIEKLIKLTKKILADLSIALFEVWATQNIHYAIVTLMGGAFKFEKSIKTKNHEKLFKLIYMALLAVTPEYHFIESRPCKSSTQKNYIQHS